MSVVAQSRARRYGVGTLVARLGDYIKPEDVLAEDYCDLPTMYCFQWVFCTGGHVHVDLSSSKTYLK